MTNILKSACQVLGFIVYSVVINKVAEMLHLPIPGSILGIILLFLMLQFKIIKLEWVDLGSKWLLAEMLLFFIPPVVGVMEYKELMLANGIKIIVVLLLSLLAVMVVTGMLAEKLSAREGKKQA